MNNLSAFTDVINGLRQAIFTLNTQFVQLRTQVEELKNKQSSSLNLDELKNALATHQNATDTKLKDMFSQINQTETLLNQQVKATTDHIDLINNRLLELDAKLGNCLCNCSSSSTLTVVDVQSLIDKSLSQLLEGVQPLTSLVPANSTVAIEESLDDISTPQITIEPPVITEVQQNVETTLTPPTPTKPKRSYRKKT